MKLLPERTAWSVLVVTGLGVILIVLAVFQYQWIGQVSEAEQERLHSGLLAAMGQFRQQFNLDLQRLGFEFEPGEGIVSGRDWHSYAISCSTLLERPGNRVVAGVYLWVFRDGESQLLGLNPRGREFAPVPWPSTLQPVRRSYERSGPGIVPPVQRPFPELAGAEVPLLVRPLLEFQPGQERSGRDRPGFLIIELSGAALRDTVLPYLAETYFSGPAGFAYRVAVFAENPRRVIYKSDPGVPDAVFDFPDESIGLWGRDPGRGGPPGGPPEMPFRPGPPPDLQADRVQGGPPPPDATAGWQLVVRHPRGSLDAAVTELRRRNLGIGFGVLLLLGVSMAFIMASARRAQRIARLQMDFVAGVSHELRTPLAVISSAGENLADGVVSGSAGQVRKYGELIRSESKRLTGMVEQILQYGKLQRGDPKYDLRPARLDEIVTNAIAGMNPGPAAEGFTVERGFAPDLPAVTADPAALTDCVRNLVQNAMKYSGNARWISIRTAPARTGRASAVELVVEDRGIGIHPEDLPRVFDAFYRGRTALSTSIHGAGLGLFLVRKAVAAMGGSIRVENNEGSPGSRFTITLPAADGAARGASGVS
jgi:signal transduction histidine kinase